MQYKGNMHPGQVIILISRQILHQLYLKVFTEDHRTSCVEQETGRKKTVSYQLVPMLLKEHQLNGQTEPKANIGDLIVHFHRGDTVCIEHSGRF
ncbi:hypothetical protein TNCT_600701 [Trichonephila clavata]|uniref:Uncharacterized protein n=1 Tax=Trichonephila clavata TaxID=2740835 RepID=A0A8X6FG34_TRICU|nr:hypothetical protein TNCT_600701 [Trichonephila clavata]